MNRSVRSGHRRRIVGGAWWRPAPGTTWLTRSGAERMPATAIRPARRKKKKKKNPGRQISHRIQRLPAPGTQRHGAGSSTRSARRSREGSIAGNARTQPWAASALNATGRCRRRAGSLRCASAPVSTARPDRRHPPGGVTARQRRTSTSAPLSEEAASSSRRSARSSSSARRPPRPGAEQHPPTVPHGADCGLGFFATSPIRCGSTRVLGPPTTRCRCARCPPSAAACHPRDRGDQPAHHRDGTSGEPATTWVRRPAPDRSPRAITAAAAPAEAPQLQGHQRPRCSGSAPRRCGPGSAAMASPARCVPWRSPSVRAGRDRGAALTLAETHNVSSAVALARERGEGPSSPARLAAAFASFDEEQGQPHARGEPDAALDRADDRGRPARRGRDSRRAARRRRAEYEFAWRHATGWMSAVKRLAPPPTRTEGILLVFDGIVPFDIDALHAQSLELMLRRAGMRTLSLSPAIDTAG